MTQAPPPSLRAQKQAVPHEFDRVAARYDLLTGMNPGYHRHLARSAERMRLPPESDILDLCCGTGLSTLALVRQYPRARITGLDASAGMLALARKKRELAGVRFLHGDAMDPAAHGAAGPWDGILMAYGIRNMPDADLCLRRLFSLLKPGGTICFHEYSVRDSLRAHLVWNAVCLGIIIPAGLITSPRSHIYRYLRRSVNAFDGAAAFLRRLQAAGFCDTHAATMDGWQSGIVHTFLARRPA
jgi:ubiquinone/menaquinone biosynthesis C-methylase UbiE